MRPQNSSCCYVHKEETLEDKKTEKEIHVKMDTQNGLTQVQEGVPEITVKNWEFGIKNEGFA
jgi:hypothetical protein